VAELGEQARAALHEPEAELGATYELRYGGQAFELPISAGTAPQPDELREAFEAEHEDRYGYRDPDQTLELVTIRVTASTPPSQVSLRADEGDADFERGRRSAVLGGEEVEVEVLRGTAAPGTEVTGPAVLELPESTLLVPADWRGEVGDTGTVRLARDDER